MYVFSSLFTEGGAPTNSSFGYRGKQIPQFNTPPWVPGLVPARALAKAWFWAWNSAVFPWF